MKMFDDNEESEMNSRIWHLIMKRIEDWKARLIDFTRRNRLLYYRRTKRSNISISRPDAITIFNKLVLRGSQLEFWLPPEESEDTEKSSQSYDSSLSEKVIPKKDQLVCEGISRNEIEKILKNLHRRSLSDYRERGVRTLFASFGMLVWKEVENSEEVRSPLLLVPIELFRESIREPFKISIPPVEEEIVLNPALQVKLQNDFRLELPPLPEEWDKNTLSDYFNSVKEVVRVLGWKIELTTEIGLFSFHKFVIYKDLDDNAKIIAQHPLIRAVAGDKDIPLVLDSLPEEKDIDDIETPEKTFHVLDADSSQRICIDYALRGQSFVMHGPPGTGKSQTIANIIAECIARGKTVLFVSEKMAALEVVYKRLREVGLANFCLELHSSKANKKEVVAELKRCLDEHLVPRKLPSDDEFKRMMQLRKKLNDYVKSLHKIRYPLGKSAYEILARLSELEKVPFIPIKLSNPRALDFGKIQKLEEAIHQLKNVWQVVEDPDFPWRGYKGEKYTVEMRLDLSALLERLISTLDSLRFESEIYAAQLGLKKPSTFEQLKWLIKIGEIARESPGPEIEWVKSSEIEQLIREARKYMETCTWCREARKSLLERYHTSLFEIPLDRSVEIKGLISNLLNLIKNIELERSDLLKKRDELLSFVSDTQRLISEWIDASKKISKILGVPIDNINIRRLKELAKIALLCFSKEKPEKSWLNPDQLKRVLNVLPHAKKDYEEFNSIRERLGKLYTDEIYELDLDNLIERYSSSYRSFLKWFRPSFHNDQKKIAGVSLEGRVPKSVLKDLLEARRLNELKTKIDSQIDTHRELFGHFYDGFHTNFERIKQACAVAEDIIKLSRVRPVPSELIELVSFDLEQKAPPPELKRIGTYLNDSINKWEEIIKDLDSLLPIDRVPCSKLPIYQTHLIDIQKWASETEKHLSHLCLLTKEVLNSCKDEPDTYEQLIQDLRKAENIRKKETEFLRQKRTLQEKFGVRFSGLTTDWEEIISILEWTKNLQKIFGSENIPDQFAEIVSRGGVYASSNHGLPTIFETYLKLLADLESRFNVPPTYQGKKLQDLDIELLYERIKVLRERVDDLQVWMDFKETRKLFRERGLEPFLNKLIECAPPSSQIIDIFFRAIYQEWIDSIFDEDPNLGRFRRENHERMIAEFRNLDQKLIRLSRYRVIQEELMPENHKA